MDDFLDSPDEAGVTRTKTTDIPDYPCYQLRRQLFSIGEDFWVQNERGENVYKVESDRH